MTFDEYRTKINDLDEQIKVANDKLASAESEESTNAAVAEISDLNNQITQLKDTFIDEQNKAYNELSKKYDKTEQERLQALKIASDNANKRPPEEKDPRKIIQTLIGG